MINSMNERINLFERIEHGNKELESKIDELNFKMVEKETMINNKGEKIKILNKIIVDKETMINSLEKNIETNNEINTQNEENIEMLHKEIAKIKEVDGEVDAKVDGEMDKADDIEMLEISDDKKDKLRKIGRELVKSRSIKVSKEIVNGNKIDIYDCDICHMNIRGNTELLKHIEIKHDKEKMYIENDFDKWTRSVEEYNALLYKHTEIKHDRDTNLECSKCGKKENSKGDIKKHMKKYH